jgi:hypothetical protein
MPSENQSSIITPSENQSSNLYDHIGFIIILILVVIIIVMLLWNNKDHFSQLNNESNTMNQQLKQSIERNYPLLYDNNINKQYEQQKYASINNQSGLNNNQIGTNLINNNQIEPNLLTQPENITTNNVINTPDKSPNFLDVKPEDLNEFAKNNYSLYAHQITCPNKCNLKVSNPCNKNNYPDITLMNKNVLEDINNKSCVTCTKNPILDRINRNYNIDSENELSNAVINEDIQRVEQKKVSFNNLDKFTNFQNEVYQNSIGETPVDKMAAVRTSQSETCGLKAYGRKIQDVYNNLMGSISYDNRYDLETSKPVGILEDQSNTNIYEEL